MISDVLTTLRGLIFAWINFRECRPRNNSRGLIFANGLKNFVWIYFREDKGFEKFKKRKTALLSIKSFYKSSKNYKYVNNFYMFDGVWSLKASKALRDGAVWWKANSRCLRTYFSHCLKYAKNQRKIVKIGKIRKHVLFESPHTNFKHRWWIFKI